MHMHIRAHLRSEIMHIHIRAHILSEIMHIHIRAHLLDSIRRWFMPVCVGGYLLATKDLR